MKIVLITLFHSLILVQYCLALTQSDVNLSIGLGLMQDRYTLNLNSLLKSIDKNIEDISEKTIQLNQPRIVLAGNFSFGSIYRDVGVQLAYSEQTHKVDDISYLNNSSTKCIDSMKIISIRNHWHFRFFGLGIEQINYSFSINDGTELKHQSGEFSPFKFNEWFYYLEIPLSYFFNSEFAPVISYKFNSIDADIIEPVLQIGLHYYFGIGTGRSMIPRN